MERYDYLETIEEDVRMYIKENELDSIEVTKKWEREDFMTDLYEKLWNEDSVTGNASGSYYCNAWKAEEALCHNWDLLEEAMEEFGYFDTNVIDKGAEWADVLIRCYLLSQAIDEVVSEFNFKGEEDYE